MSEKEKTKVRAAETKVCQTLVSLISDFLIHNKPPSSNTVASSQPTGRVTAVHSPHLLKHGFSAQYTDQYFLLRCTSLKPWREHRRWLGKEEREVWSSVSPSAQWRPEAGRYWVKTPFSSDVPLRQVLSEWAEVGGAGKELQRCSLLTETDGPRLHHRQGQKDVQLLWPPHVCTPRNCAFTHGTLSRGENEMTAEKRANRAAWVEEEERELFADTARLVLRQYILSPCRAMEGWLCPSSENERAAY